MTIGTIHSAQSHFGWDNSRAPVSSIAPGIALTFEVVESSGRQLTADSASQDLATLDFARVTPITGPVFIEGAKPGDAIRIRFDRFEPSTDWAWTALIPGFGLLADEFPDPELHVWKYDSFDSQVAMGTWANVPLQPFVGTIGLAPAEPGAHSVIPPRRVGGNIDTRDLSVGSELLLPVEVDGALLSIGDGHAAQGDGEVCGTAIETSMNVTVTLDLVRDANVSTPVFERIDRRPQSQSDESRYLATTGIGPDLMTCVRDAVRAMIDQLGKRLDVPPEAAYMLCSVAGDLRIAEVVDAPNWLVACHVPLAIFQ